MTDVTKRVVESETERCKEWKAILVRHYSKTRAFCQAPGPLNLIRDLARSELQPENQFEPLFVVWMLAKFFYIYII